VPDRINTYEYTVWIQNHGPMSLSSSNSGGDAMTRRFGKSHGCASTVQVSAIVIAGTTRSAAKGGHVNQNARWRNSTPSTAQTTGIRGTAVK